MKKIIKDVKAGVMPIVAILVVAILIGAILVFYDSSGTSEQWETENEFGSWKQDLILEFEDGSSEPVSSIMASEVMAVYYGGKKITGFVYQIEARGTGEGYDTATIDLSNLGVTMLTLKGNSAVNEFRKSFPGTKNLDLNNKWKNLYGFGGTISIGFPGSLNPGIYELKFISSGSIRYKGNPGGSYQSASKPPPVSYTMEVKSDQGTLSIQFKNSVTF